MRGNRPFMPGAGPNGGEFFIPWRMLRERFAGSGIEINTPDMNDGRTVSFDLHLNAQRRLAVDRPCYAYLYEDPLVRPINADRAQIARYRKVFTSNETLINGQNVHRLDYPNDLALHKFLPWGARDLFCVLIASNKALRHPNPRSLHEQRVQTIRYFEAHVPESFALFGSGWNIPAVRPGAWGRIIKRVNEWREKSDSAPPAFPSYRGFIPGPKRDVLARARFCICYENVRGSPGYLTEKIFDCFASGCVPVYMGAVDALTSIPDECYIDGGGQHTLLPGAALVIDDVLQLHFFCVTGVMIQVHHNPSHLLHRRTCRQRSLRTQHQSQHGYYAQNIFSCHDTSPLVG